MMTTTDSTLTPPPGVRVPEKPLLHVTEAVWIIAPYLGRTYAAVERQINRGIQAGTINATVHLGRRMMTRETVIHILRGDPA